MDGESVQKDLVDEAKEKVPSPLFVHVRYLVFMHSDGKGDFYIVNWGEIIFLLLLSSLLRL